MSSVREYPYPIFGDIVTQFKFSDFKENVKVSLSPIRKQYRISSPLVNAHMHTATPKNTFSIYNHLFLTVSRRRPLSYRNQSIDLLRLESVKECSQ